MIECAIIAGGVSLTSLELKKINELEMDKIVCNKSIFDIPSAKYFITLDYSFLSKLENQTGKFFDKKLNKVFVANLHPSYMKKENDSYIDTRTEKAYDLSAFDIIFDSYNKDGFGSTLAEFGNGYHSGFCAIQLALLMDYKDIYLFGFDYVCQDNVTHYHGGYKESVISFQPKLDQYYKTLKRAIIKYQKNHDVNIYNCSKISQLNELLTYKEI